MYEIKKMDFWPYEIFGYLTPGAFLTAVISINNQTARSVLLTIKSDHGVTASLAVFVVVSYVLGHMVSALSSLLLERIIVSNFLRYPTSILLRLKNNDRSILSCLGQRVMAFKPFSWLRFTAIIRLASKNHMTVTRWIVLKTLRFQPLQWLAYRIVVRGYDRAYPETMCTALIDKFCEVFKFDKGEVDEHSIYWHCWQWALLRADERLYKYGFHFIDLYGFCRNTSMVLLLLVIMPSYADADTIMSRSDAYWRLIFFISGILMFGNYARLMRRHNDVIYRSFYVSQLLPVPYAPAPEASVTGPLSGKVKYQTVPSQDLENNKGAR